MTRLWEAIILMFILLAPSQAFPPQEAREVLRRAIRAVGGERYLDVYSLVIVGESIADLPIIGRRHTTFTIYRQGRLYRRESVAEGKRTIVGFDGRAYWMVVQGHQITPPQAVVDGLHRQFEVELSWLIRFEKKRGHLQAKGRQSINEKMFDVVEVTTAEGRTITYFFDATTSLLTRIERPQDRWWGLGRKVRTTILRDYRVVDGMRFPFLKEDYIDGRRVVQERLQKITVNPELSPALFAHP